MKTLCLLVLAGVISSVSPAARGENLDDCMAALRAKEAHDFNGALLKFKGCFEKGGLSDRSKVVTLRQAGFMFRDAGDLKGAIEYYEKAMQYKSDDPWADLVNRGNAYSQMRSFDLALADYASALKLKPDYAEAFYNRGVTFEEMRQPEKAKAEFVAAYKAGMRTDYLYSRLVTYGLVRRR